MTIQQVQIDNIMRENMLCTINEWKKKQTTMAYILSFNDKKNKNKKSSGIIHTPTDTTLYNAKISQQATCCF